MVAAAYAQAVSRTIIEEELLFVSLESEPVTSVPRWQHWSWRAKAIAVALILLSGLAYVYKQRNEGFRLRAVEANNVKAHQLKAEIDRRFAIGTSEAKVVTFLRAAHPDHRIFPGANRNEFFAPVGFEPSNVWFCGSFQAGVMLRCHDGRLISTEITRWSADCL